MKWINKLQTYLDLRYSGADAAKVNKYAKDNFPSSAVRTLDLLPTNSLNAKPLYALLDGFRTDLEFETANAPPIHDESDLELYGTRVAGTVGELCLDLVFHHTAQNANKTLLYDAAREMGIGLQYVNIARDVAVDAKINRVYLPTSWLKEEELTPQDVIARPFGPKIERLRNRLLGKAFEKYRGSRKPMDLLPKEARGAMMVAVESYMEIGRVLAEGGQRREYKATVPLSRRVGVVFKTLTEA